MLKWLFRSQGVSIFAPRILCSFRGRLRSDFFVSRLWNGVDSESRKEGAPEDSPMSDVVAEKDAVAKKASLHPGGAAGRVAAAVKTWHFLNFASTAAAANFLNAAPAQVAGEVSANARNDGTVGVFYFL
jgi:hypothetical protein